MTNDMVVRNDMTIGALGQIFAQSGYFSDARDAAQAVVKIMAGRELGLPPIASMTGINIIKGKVSLSATVMAAVLRRNPLYDYRVREHTDDLCKIEFFYKGESLGISKFDKGDAQKAGLLAGDNYKKYPRNMMFARAMSNGIRWYCPEILGGPAYTPGELDAGADSEGETNGATVEGELLDFSQQLQQDQNITLRIRQLKELHPDSTVSEIQELINDEIKDLGLDLSVGEVAGRLS